MHSDCLRIWIGLSIFLLAPPSKNVAAPPSPLEILQKQCVSCHSPAKRKGGLSIESRESLLRGGDTGPALVPGNSAESFLFETLFPDADPHMPPKDQLSPREIETLESWIKKGAPWDATEWDSLNRLAKKEVKLTSFPSRYAPVLAAALSADGARFAAGKGSQLLLFDVVFPDPKKDPKKKPALRLLASSQSQSDLVQSLAFSPDGKWLVAGGYQSLRFYRLGDSEELAAPAVWSDPFLGRITALEFSPGGKRLAVADSVAARGARIVLTDPLQRKVLRAEEFAHDDTIFDLCWNGAGSQIVSASADQLAIIRDAKSLKQIQTLEGHIGYVLGAVFDPKGQRVATGGDDAVVKVWNAKTGNQISSFATGKSGPVGGVAWVIDPDNAAKKKKEKDKKKAEEINTDRIVAINDLGQPGTFTNLNEHEGEQRSTGAREQRHSKVDTALTSMVLDRERLILFAGSEDGRIFFWDKAGKLAGEWSEKSDEKQEGVKP